MKKIFALLLGAAVALSSVAIAKAPMPVKDIKAGFICTSFISDGGYGQMHERGRLYMHSVYPELPKSTIIENTPENHQSLEVMEQLIKEGHNLIFATSFGYMEYVQQLAAKYPHVTFMHCAGYKTAPNVGTYFGRMYQARYLSGMAAGTATKTETVGFVAAFPIPEVARAINAFTLGVRAVNPQAKVRVVWTYSWSDEEKEREAALALIESGCDVLGMHVDTGVVPLVAEDKGVYVVGYNNDMSSFAPTKHLVSAVWNWGIAYENTIERLAGGNWTNDQLWWGLDTGLVGLSKFGPDVTREAKSKIATAQNQMVSGKWDVFTGPIYDQDGVIMVEPDKKMTDQEMLQMALFVQGVEVLTPARIK